MGKSFTNQAIKDLAKSQMESELGFHKLIGFVGSSGYPLAINTGSVSVLAAYKKWRVEAVGFVVIVDGISTENPEVEFGVGYGDITTDNDYFGSVIQDVNANKHFVQDDVYIKDPKGLLGTPLALGNDGTHTWDAGGGQLGVWQENTTSLIIMRPNDHTLTISAAFMLLEVKQ